MAPLVVNVKNTSTKPRDLYTSDGVLVHIPNGKSAIINKYLDGTIDTKIQVNSSDVRSYLLKYDSADKSVNKIVINDSLGRTKSVPDTHIWAKNEEEDLDIEICEQTIIISAAEKDLRLYESGGGLSVKHYQAVVASNNGPGGIIITGVDANLSGTHNDEDEDEGEH